MDISVTPNKTTIVADAHKIPFQNNCFDIVFASEVFEHLRDPQVFVNEAFRVIKKNGKLIITVPFMFHEHADPCDFWRPTKTSLRMLCSRYSEVKVSNQGNRLHSIFDLITTAFSPWPIFFPFRILNHLLVLPFGNSATIFDNSTAPSGFILIAVK